MKTNTDRWWNPISATVLIVLLTICVALFYFQLIHPVGVAALVLLSFFVARAINIANQWEKRWFSGWGNIRA